jgi:hypothetical protein
MKRFFGRALPAAIIPMMIFSAVSAFAVTDKPSPVPPPEMKAEKAEAPLNVSSLSGKVVETMNAGGYTYVSLEKDGKKTWIAIPVTEVKVGQKVTYLPGAEMRNFTSKTLNRTFESIIFSPGLVSPGSAAANQPSSSQHGDKKAEAPKSIEKISVEKATGPDAYTVSEIYANIATLNEKTAVVKGKVVKVSQGIMGKNWIHLKDGTGDDANQTNKLVTTSQDLPAVGDIVTMKGTIYKDKDFGAGYKYAVIMENASIQH